MANVDGLEAKVDAAIAQGTAAITTINQKLDFIKAYVKVQEARGVLQPVSLSEILGVDINA